MRLNEETLGAGYYFATISTRLAPGMSSRASKLPMLRRILSFTARIWHADRAGGDLPLLHRLAIVYLMVPLIIWLIGWFNWWFGIPAAVLIILGFRQALSGPLRLSLPRPMTFAILLLAAVWMMSTAAGGVFDASNARLEQTPLDFAEPWLLPLANLHPRFPRTLPVPRVSFALSAPLLPWLVHSPRVFCPSTWFGRVELGRAALDVAGHRTHPATLRPGTTWLERHFRRRDIHLLRWNGLSAPDSPRQHRRIWLPHNMDGPSRDRNPLLNNL